LFACCCCFLRSRDNAIRVLAGRAHELDLLRGGLEAAGAHLGRSVDELEVDLLERRALGVRLERLAERDAALLGADDAALDHDVRKVDDTVAEEATERRDRLGGEVKVGARVEDLLAVLERGLADAVDLLVELRAVVVTLLAGTRDRVPHAGGVPRANARNLAQTLVGLARELGDAPPGREREKRKKRRKKS
jgi:hypothetical protein